MVEYLASLERLRKIKRVARICPGHGDVMDDPAAVLEEYVAPQAAGAQIMRLLAKGPAKIKESSTALYVDTPEGLLEMAGRRCTLTSSSSRPRARSPGRQPGRPGRGLALATSGPGRRSLGPDRHNKGDRRGGDQLFINGEWLRPHRARRSRHTHRRRARRSPTSPRPGAKTRNGPSRPRARRSTTGPGRRCRARSAPRSCARPPS